MTGWLLRAKQIPELRVDLRGVTPLALAELSRAEVERIPLGYGNAWTALGEWFHVEARADASLVFAADLARFDRLGWQMNGGSIVVEGDAGDYAGACMTDGEIEIKGSGRDLAACEMAGGTLRVAGNVGAFAASTLPGSMDGMRGGTLVVRGNAGERFADRMRRGTAVVFGDAADFLASRMVAGTVALGGHCGAQCGYAMRRGSVVFAGSHPDVSPTFIEAINDAAVFWQLLARDLARHGGVFADLPARRCTRHLGDLAAGGQGELITVM